MDKLFSYLKAMNRHTKAVFDLSLTRGLDYYTGLIFEIVLKDNGKELGSISGGGRYDNLIGMFSNNQIPAVGGSIGI
jgi:histidyl-tRNA synthetase